MTPSVFCETVELAVEATALAQAIGLAVSIELSADPLGAAAQKVAQRAGPACALSLTLPSADSAITALHVCSEPQHVVVGGVSDADRLQRGLLRDLGFVCVGDVAPALAALALLTGGAARAHAASPRKLSPPDRLRLAGALGTADRAAGRLVSLGADGVAHQAAEGRTSLRAGGARALAEALQGLSAAQRLDDPSLAFARPDALEPCRDVLFGPPRTLSDPASKVALAPFGLPLPQEELCSSPSRAAVEGARIGFPVRISLASPDLRVWDYPDLSVDGVDNAARVRDVYRQLVLTAEARAPEARVLGVTVTATTLARALLRVTARPLRHGRVLVRVGFCDPHGAVAKDAVATVLPQSALGIRRALARLAGRALLWDDAAPPSAAQPLIDLLVRLGSFVDAFRREVARVELHPVALLVGGGAEIREAAVQITDAFVQDMDLAPAAP
jgi:ATP-grasp domain